MGFRQRHYRVRMFLMKTVEQVADEISVIETGLNS